jgi:SAM-dependent methyltransferase
VTEPVDCYDVPQYWDLAFDEDTLDEAEFIAAAAAKYCDFPLKSLYEPGCGGGRLVVQMARRGYAVQGIDLSQSSVEYANSRLQTEQFPESVSVGDMRTYRVKPQVDIAYCFVNTFRHLLTEEDAVQHLQSVAASLRPGGLYLLGLHMLPPDADEEDDEEWSVTQGDVTVNMRLDAFDCDRELRLETLRFQMEVLDPGHPQALQFASDYRMRIYEADQMLSLLAKVPEFTLLDVYDFWYDIDEPQMFSDEMGDTVFVLQRMA